MEVKIMALRFEFWREDKVGKGVYEFPVQPVKQIDGSDIENFGCSVPRVKISSKEG
jgi:hypothetical protein